MNIFNRISDFVSGLIELVILFFSPIDTKKIRLEKRWKVTYLDASKYVRAEERWEKYTKEKISSQRKLSRKILKTEGFWGWLKVRKNLSQERRVDFAPSAAAMEEIRVLTQGLTSCKYLGRNSIYGEQGTRAVSDLFARASICLLWFKYDGETAAYIEDMLKLCLQS